MSTTVYRGETDLENNNNVQKHTGKVKKFLQEWAFPLVCFVAVWILVKVVFPTAIIPTASMYPTLPSPCFSFSTRAAYWENDPERGDIVLFKRDIPDSKVYAKRIVGVVSVIAHHEIGVFWNIKGSKILIIRSLSQILLLERFPVDISNAVFDFYGIARQTYDSLGVDL